LTTAAAGEAAIGITVLTQDGIDADLFLRPLQAAVRLMFWIAASQSRTPSRFQMN
jgi:hypothetical protein